jgi:hypothetical protein
VDVQQVVANSAPTLLVSGDNDRMDVFTLGQDSKLNTARAMVWAFGTSWADTSQTSGWEPPNLSSFQTLGGIFPPAQPGQPGPAVAAWRSGRLDVFAVGMNGAMFHKWAEGQIKDANAWLPAYPKWEDLGGNFGSGPAVTSLGPNRLDIFALSAGSSDGKSGFEMLHKSWDPIHGWTPPNPKWNPVGNGKFFKSAPAVAASGESRLDVFALGGDTRMYHNWSDDGGVIWQPTWHGLGSQMFHLGF